MANVEYTTAKIVDLVLGLPSEQKKDVLIALASEAHQWREQRMTHAEEQLRRLGATRGMDWDRMSEDEREAFADELIHESRRIDEE